MSRRLALLFVALATIASLWTTAAAQGLVPPHAAIPAKPATPASPGAPGDGATPAVPAVPAVPATPEGTEQFAPALEVTDEEEVE